MQMYNLRPLDATEATTCDIDAIAGALADMEPTDANIIMGIYAGANMADAVREAATCYRLRESHVWRMIDDFGRRFARLRGLI